MSNLAMRARVSRALDSTRHKLHSEQIDAVIAAVIGDQCSPHAFDGSSINGTTDDDFACWSCGELIDHPLHAAPPPPPEKMPRSGRALPTKPHWTLT